MNTRRVKFIEQLKNILLVVLVLSTILLLYFLWNDDAGFDFRVPGTGNGDAETIPIEEVLSPERITVNFGAENYTALSATASLWYGSGPDPDGAPAFMPGLTRFLASDNIVVGAISEEDFLDVMRARSIRADFSFAIPLADFCAQFGLQRPAQLDAIDTFSCVAYSEASPESLFLCNKRDDRYYRLAVEGESGFRELITFVETLDYVSYYPLRTFAGVENDVMLPLDMAGGPARLSYMRSFDVGDEADAERITEMTRAFFGKSFDFTRKITEGNGTVVYMYGYGEKVLVINRDGSFEYSATEFNRDGAAGFFVALTAALDFMASHGEPEDAGRASNRVYLKDAAYTFADGRGTYSFLFGVRIDGDVVYYADSEPLTVEVTGRRVSYYKWDMIGDVSTEDAAAPAPGKAYAPFDLLTEHFAYIYDVLSARGLAAPPENASDEESLFEAVAGMVSGLSSGLLRPSGGTASGEAPADSQGASDGDAQSLFPVWTLTVEGVEFYFDLYTGARAGYRG
jgi:hypothetical protein